MWLHDSMILQADLHLKCLHATNSDFVTTLGPYQINKEDSICTPVGPSVLETASMRFHHLRETA